MDESDLIIEFMKISKCDRADAISCLSAWGYDLKKALIDYNGNRIDIAQSPFHVIKVILIADTSTQNYFKSKTKSSRAESDDDFPRHLNSQMDIHHQAKTSSSGIHQNTTDKDSKYRPLLTKTNSIDLDCKFSRLKEKVKFI